MKWICLVFFILVTGLGFRGLIAGEVYLGHGARPQQRLSGVVARIVAVLIILVGIAFTYWVVESWDRF
jgi:hypothetical protein